MYCSVFRTYPHCVQFGKLWVVRPLAIGWLTIPHTWLYHHGQHQQCHLQKSFVFWTIKRIYRRIAENMSEMELTCIKTEYGAPNMWNKAPVDPTIIVPSKNLAPYTLFQYCVQWVIFDNATMENLSSKFESFNKILNKYCENLDEEFLIQIWISLNRLLTSVWPQYSPPWQHPMLRNPFLKTFLRSLFFLAPSGERSGKPIVRKK